MDNDNNISFSSEVAETLGIECAVILSLYKNDKLNDVSSLNSILNSTKKILSFSNIFMKIYRRGDYIFQGIVFYLPT